MQLRVAVSTGLAGRMAAIREEAGGRRQRAVMATDTEWEGIGRAAAASGMDLSRFVIHRALDRDLCRRRFCAGRSARCW